MAVGNELNRFPEGTDSRRRFKAKTSPATVWGGAVTENGSLPGGADQPDDFTEGRPVTWVLNTASLDLGD